VDHRRWAFYICTLFSLVIAGCGGTTEPAGYTTPNDIVTDLVPTEETSGSLGGFHFGEDAGWPDYIPKDIPILEGDIYTVMEAPGSHIRLLYQNTTKEQLEEYLTLLEEEGFQLEFIVYVDERYPDRADEKRARGEYDAVDFTKGEYHMRLEVGSDGATYDIYTSGFEDAVVTATTLQWPEDLAVLLPAPERCEIISIYPKEQEVGYQITCETEDDDVLEDYRQVLQGLGFKVKQEFFDQDGEPETVELDDGVTTVLLSNIFTAKLGIEAWQSNTADTLQWPEEFAGLIPPPERCETTAIIPTLEGDYQMSCEPEDGQVLTDYLQVLEGLGFEELRKSLNLDGEIMIVSLQKGGTTVELMVNSPDSLGVQISQDQP
jgi:hypothetical protein